MCFSLNLEKPQRAYAFITTLSAYARSHCQSFQVTLEETELIEVILQSAQEVD